MNMKLHAYECVCMNSCANWGGGGINNFWTHLWGVNFFHTFH